MVMSDVSAAGWTRIDLVGKFIFQICALIGLLLLAQKVWRRDAANGAACSTPSTRA
jgi:hypothetical protein